MQNVYLLMHLRNYLVTRDVKKDLLQVKFANKHAFLIAVQIVIACFFVSDAMLISTKIVWLIWIPVHVTHWFVHNCNPVSFFELIVNTQPERCYIIYGLKYGNYGLLVGRINDG